MRGPISPDGKLGAFPEGGGQAALFFERETLGADVVERAVASDPSLILLGRSVLGQLGVDISMNGNPVEGASDTSERGLWVPIDIETYTGVGAALASDVSDLLDDKQPGEILNWRNGALPFGRFADMQSLQRLEASDVQKDIDQAVISFDPRASNISPRNDTYRINDDGSVAVKLAPLEFKLNDAHLRETPGIEAFGIPPKAAPPEVRLELLHRGRAGIQRNSWAEHKDPAEPLPDFLLGGVLLSPGGRYWSIRKHVADGVFQLPSAAHLDGNRIDGIGEHLDDYFRHRQVELVVNGENHPTFDETYVTLDLFRAKEMSSGAPINWLRMTPEARRRRHLMGVTALQALETSDENTRRALFEIVERPEVSALVLSRKGVTVVPEAGNPNANRRLIKNALRQSPEGMPEGLEHLKTLVERLNNAGDKTSTVVAQELRFEHLPDLVDDGGASAILAGRYVGENGAITSDELAMLSSLRRKNVGLAHAEGGDYREFHQMGLWAKPGVDERLESPERVFIALFGAARPWVGKKFHAEIGALMDELIEVEGGPDGLAFVHGNGDGTMRSTCENARQRGILSLGTGINAEKNGQGTVNTEADGVINMETWDWIVRQHQLDTHASVAYVVEGAHGTGAEVFNMITSRKLQIRLPAPMFVRNPNGEFDGIREQIKINTDQDARPGSARLWVANTVHYINSLPESRDRFERFRRDMPGYWDEIGAPPEHIALAFARRAALLNRMGLRMPVSEYDAVMSYAGHLIAK